jgi:ParB-like chromosome segregation protein Spo0J
MPAPLDASLYRLKLDDLVPFPGNPRRGDVAAIADSLRTNGQFAPIVVSSETSRILSGNHTAEAARSLGWETIEAYVVVADEQQERRIVAAANRTADLATYDNGELVALLQSIDDLDGTGYSDDNLATFLTKLDERDFQPEAGEDPRLDQKRLTRCPHCGTEFEATTYNVRADAVES